MQLLLAICFFGEFTLAGFALFTILVRGRDNARMLLLSPAIGASAIVLIALPLSRFGVPTAEYSRPLLAILDIAAVLVILRNRPRLSKAALFFLVPLGVVFLGLGLPLITAGSNWMAYSNEDAITPLYIAQWLTHHGMFSPPSSDTFIWNKDLVSTAWAVDVFGNGNRTAAACLLSTIASAVGISPLYALMPALVAGYAALVFATGALVTLVRRSRPAVLFAMLWAAISSVGAYSVYNQNADQIFGLGALVTAIAVLTPRSFYLAPFGIQLRRAIPAAIALAALSQFYPEMAALVTVPWALVSVAWLWSKRARLQRWAVAGACVAMPALVFVNISLLAPFVMLSYVATQNPLWGNFDYLAPGELANMWGFIGSGQPNMDWLAGPAISAGAVMVAALVVSVVYYARRLFLPAIVAVAMLLAFPYFVWAHVGYSVSKIVMYLQPFAIAIMTLAAFSAWAWLRLGSARYSRFAIAPLIALGLAVIAGTNATAYELLRSIDRLNRQTASFVGIRGATRDGLIQSLSDQLAHSQARVLVSDAASVVLGRYEALMGEGRPLLFPSRDPAERLSTGLIYTGFLADPNAVSNAAALIALRDQFNKSERFLFDPSYQPASFSMDSRLPANATLQPYDALLATSAGQTVLNRAHVYGPAPVMVVPGPRVHNHLVFVISSLGAHGPEDPNQSFGNAGPDFIDTDEPIEVISRRFLLLQAWNPSPRSRLLLGMTESPADGSNQTLPQVAVYGESKAKMDVVGDGAAQLYSAPVTPKTIDGQAYIILDAGKDSVNGVAAYARNISLVTEKQFRERSVPSTDDSFPSALFKSGARFSGVYEDGWIGSDAQLELRTASPWSTFFIQGQNPQLEERSAVTLGIYIDGMLRLRKRIPVGDFSVYTSVKLPPGIHTVELRGTPVAGLQPPDVRHVSVLINAIGFRVPR